MKRLICILLALLLCVSLCACSLPFGAKEHVHTWRSATCSSPSVCESCGETRGFPLPHSYGEFVMDLPAGKMTAGKQHATCTVCGFVLNKEIPALGSEGLSYELSEDGTSCTVTGMGSCTNTQLFIPAAIEGHPVTAIGVYAFKDCSALTDIHIPASVTQIQAGAFAFCEGLSEVTVPDSVTVLGSDIFVGCENLQKVTLPQSYTGVLDGIFSECTRLQQVTIPTGVTALDDGCFRSCESLQSIEIPEGVTTIGMDVFLWCKSLQDVQLPASVTLLDINCFADCQSLQTIVYNGTMAQWDQIQNHGSWDHGAGDYTVICTDGQIH